MKIVANDISTRFTNMIHGMTKDDEQKEQPVRPSAQDFMGVKYLSEVGSNTIDLIGEPAVQSFFMSRRQDEVTKQVSPRVVSTGTDFHKAYVPQ